MTETNPGPTEVIVVGTSSDVRTLAERLAESRSVVFFTDRPDLHREAEQSGVSTYLTSFDAGIEHDGLTGDVAFVATDRDSTNLLVAQHFRVNTDVETVVARVNDSAREVAFDGIASETVCSVDLYEQTVQETLQHA